MPDREREWEILEKRYFLSKERTAKCELDLENAKNKLLAIKSEIRELQGYLEDLKAELRQKVRLLDEINGRIDEDGAPNT